MISRDQRPDEYFKNRLVSDNFEKLEEDLENPQMEAELKREEQNKKVEVSIEKVLLRRRSLK